MIVPEFSVSRVLRAISRWPGWWKACPWQFVIRFPCQHLVTFCREIAQQWKTGPTYLLNLPVMFSCWIKPFFQFSDDQGIIRSELSFFSFELCEVEYLYMPALLQWRRSLNGSQQSCQLDLPLYRNQKTRTQWQARAFLTAYAPSEAFGCSKLVLQWLTYSLETQIPSLILTSSLFSRTTIHDRKQRDASRDAQTSEDLISFHSIAPSCFDVSQRILGMGTSAKW
jgi:hypothetical protein